MGYDIQSVGYDIQSVVVIVIFEVLSHFLIRNVLIEGSTAIKYKCVGGYALQCVTYGTVKVGFTWAMAW